MNSRTVEKEGVKLWAVGLLLGAVALFVGYFYWMAVTMSSKGPEQVPSVARFATQNAMTATARAEIGPFVSGSSVVELTSTPGGSVLPFGSVAVESTPESVTVASAARSARPVGRVVWGGAAAPGWRVVDRGDGGVSGGGVLALSTPEPGQFIGDVVYASYWPDDGPLWCADYDEGAERCVSPVTAGMGWRDVVNEAAACPAEWLGRLLDLPGVGRFRCLDTGPGARCDAGYCSVYLLRRDYVHGIVSGVLF